MSKQDNLTDFLTDVADAIREKKGSSEKINPQNFSEEIKNLPSGEEVNTFGEVMVDKMGVGFYGVKQVVFPEGLTEIKDSAYHSNQSIAKFVIPNSVTRIGSMAFYNSSIIASVDISEDSLLEYIGQYAFTNDSIATFVLPIGVNVINYMTFSGCRKLKSIKILGEITYIGYRAFYNCIELKVLNFGKNTSIPNLDNVDAFSNTTCQFIVPDALYDEWIAATNWSTYADRIVKASEYVYIDFADPVVEKICAENFGDGIGTTQAQANAVTTFPLIFKRNTEITSFDEFEKFENVTSIGTEAFYGCENLIKIKIPQKTEVLAQACFSNCKNLTEINLERVKSLNQSALQQCTSIKEISMPNLVGEVPYMCFYYMSSLEKVLDLGSITVVGASAFQFCRKLTYIKLPSTVVSINNAFGSCSALSTLIVDTPYPPTLKENAFKDSPSISIYVPDESVGAYKSATNWSAYADRIKPLSEYQPNNE